MTRHEVRHEIARLVAEVINRIMASEPTATAFGPRRISQLLLKARFPFLAPPCNSVLTTIRLTPRRTRRTQDDYHDSDKLAALPRCE